MKRILLMVAMLFWCVDGWAQATAQISGTVRDQSGAVLPGVEVTASQTETGISRMTISNETGSYILSNLAVGPYRFEAALPGFRTFVQTGIVLQVDSNPVINPQLEVGQVTEQVEVQANAALVETRSTAVGQVIENERILELPLNGRQVTDLITLSGAAVQTAIGGRATWQGAVFISVAGGQSFGVMYSLDGAMHNNVYDGSQMPMPFPDALQEFKVEASGSSAAGGTRGSGGHVNAVTKSGTNEFHGDLFEFVRNYQFNARNFFALKRDSLKRNQYGGTLGGPIVANKVFFFAGYQGTKTRSDPGNIISFVPTAAMLAGDFTAFASPACNAGRQFNLTAPFVNNLIDPALFSKPAVNIAAKLPKAYDECGRTNFGLVEKRNEGQYVGKVDYQWSDKQSVFGRYMATRLGLPHPYELSKNVLTTISEGFDNLAQSYALGDTYLIGPRSVNAFRLSVNRIALVRAGAHFFSAPQMGVKGYSDLNDHMLMSVTGGPTIGNRGDSTFMTTAYQMGDDLNLLRGNHQMTFGGNIAHWRTNQRAHLGDMGNYSFNGSVTGLGMADFFTGKLTTLSQQTVLNYGIRQWYLGAYGADVWKAKPSLSVSYGIRWEPFLPFDLSEGSMPNFSDDRFRNNIHSTVYPTAPAGLYFPGDPGFPKGKNRPVVTKWRNVAPRLGLAWDPKGDGRTSIRASYGIAYDFTGSFFLSGASNSPPVGFQTTVQSPAGGFEDPWRDYAGGIPFPLDRSVPRFPILSSYYLIGKHDMATPAVQSWNLSLQRQVAGDFLLSGSYLGSHTTHLWVSGNINRAIYFAGGPCSINGLPYNPCSATSNTNQRRRLFIENPQQGQFYSSLAVREDGGTQSYHGMLLSIQRRAARGVNVGANYTWSHCLGNNPTGLATGSDSPGYLDPNNRDFDRGNCDSDRRQVFNLTAVASTPQFANRALRMLGTGWRLSGIYRKSTGSYLTLTTGLDRLLSGAAANQRPNQVLENPYGDRNSLTKYLNPLAFAQPAIGTMGNIRPFNVVGPGTWQLDLALSRVFHFREKHNVEFRAEGFNVTNSLVAGNPATNLNQNTFGQITSSADARIMQFALKYTF
jgi:hypothetical protein